jgi:DNA-binding transcriptional ArsR family regulator
MGAADKFPSVEAALDASPSMLTVLDIKRATGLDEPTLRAQLKALAQQGQIDHIPGRGRYDGRYGLLRPIQKADQATAVDDCSPVGDSEGGEADVRAIPALEYDPATVSLHPIERAAAQQNRADEAEHKVASLLNVIADIRAAIGDDGRIMLYELADAVRKRSEMAELGLRVSADFAETATELDAVRAALGAVIGGDIDPSDLTEAEIAQRAAQLITVELANARALNTKLEHLLGSERTANAALREQLDNTVSPEIWSIAPAGYLVRAPKRRLRILSKPENAQAAAMAAAASGSVRGEVFALLSVGTARRGAVWKPSN